MIRAKRLSQLFAWKIEKSNSSSWQKNSVCPKPAKSKNREVIDMKQSKTVTIKVGRDAKTGRFIPVKAAKKRKTTTVVETIKRPVKKK